MAKKKISTPEPEVQTQQEKEPLSEREIANQKATERVKLMLSTASCRDGSEHSVETIQFDLSGTPITIKGIANGHPTFWNINGIALSTQDRGLDLVNEEKI